MLIDTEAETAIHTLTARYQHVTQTHFVPDPHQTTALQALERLRQELTAQEPPGTRRWRWFPFVTRRRSASPRGVYLWGGVGRGKTWLMDLFFDTLPDAHKQRSHFHRFMQGVHAGLKRHKNQVDPLASVAEEIAERAQVVCLDELYVSDIADAMLLGGLFSHLIERGCALVFTSNLPPEGLYRDGLQRQRFLPAIALLQEHCEVVCVDGPVDYRLRQLVQRPIYLPSDQPQSATQLRQFFAELSDDAPCEPATLQIEGRELNCLALADTVIWFAFDVLCGGPRSQADYVSLAKEFQTVIVSDVPVMDGSDDNAARRFIALIDEFYDRRVNLIISAAAETHALYRGERLRFEFERTTSRLIEMQSEAYLASEHRIS